MLFKRKYRVRAVVHQTPGKKLFESTVIPAFAVLAPNGKEVCICEEEARAIGICDHLNKGFIY